jgi:AraC family transcriptional regulator of adaptative response/methylated-DNA-[protein]-cysteine methyltransferase
MTASLLLPTTLLPADADAWRAVSARDAHYDGRFVYAVRSTRVYCRPSCPSRRPTRANVRYFLAPEDAESAGYRACLRCRPREERALLDSERAVARARAYLDQHAGETTPLAKLAAHAGASPFHLQRSFKRLLGVSPKQYQSALRASRFKARLRAGDTVSRATYEAGYGSSSRVYEQAHDLLGMSPAAYRRGGLGLRIEYTIADSPVGRVLVGVTERGVCSVALGGTDAEVEAALRADFPRATLTRAGRASHDWVRAVLERIRHPHKPGVSSIPLDVNGTAFQWKVWKALQAIPVGTQQSYSAIAAAVGQPRATRAVARACASNRVAVVIPCHRVVRQDGEIGAYKWGAARKRKLLAAERD